MTQEERELLLKDLCARLPYGTICEDIYGNSGLLLDLVPELNSVTLKISELGSTWTTGIDNIKHYLRPMSSMTEEELNECVEQSGIGDVKCPNWNNLPKEKHFEARLNHSINMFLVDSRTIDWLNAHHFDYRGLIPMGLGIDCTGLNIYEKEYVGVAESPLKTFPRVNEFECVAS